ncbi:cytochrome b/b6 domain-containing protein [Aminobacter sp. SS-2016]|uniref:cytochrome b n=1 Tax=Aminobacter sp. Y103A TaxID=1870862 RepID=UPI0025732D53|nr:cytochrome b/b6 domain-containing protein [Aminobacter sp. SS-2016]
MMRKFRSAGPASSEAQSATQGEMRMTRQVSGYSTAQVALHWSVVVLVAFQYLAHDGMEAAWRAFLRNEPSAPDTSLLAYMHVVAGVTILLLALARVHLRLTRGAPPPPPDEPRLLQILSEAVHGLIYLSLFLLPLSGGVAWFAGVEAAAAAHNVLKTALLGAIVLHIAGALFQHFVRRSDVMMRMFRPQRS